MSFENTKSEVGLMEEIKAFSPEVCAQLKYYVYRLVNPQNGQTFYVGKGKGNRVFAHAKCALKDYEGVDYSSEDDDEDNLKYKTIRDIKRAGLEVIYIIQKYDLEEKEALAIESALIDIYSIRSDFTNKIKGFNTTDPTNAIALQRKLATPEYKDSASNPKYIIIKVKDYWIQQQQSEDEDEARYECTRSAWKMKKDRAEQYPYVLSVTGGIVEEVYKVNEWHYREGQSSGRIEFTGSVAEPKVRDIFKGKRIPAKYRQKGNASPCLYCQPDKT